MQHPVPEDAVAAVFARAAELDAAREPGTPPTELDVDALVEVGESVGLSADSVRRAVAEHHAGALVRSPAPPATWVGPRVAVAERRLDADPDRVRRSLERSLERQWFRKVRGGDGRSLWCARDDVAAKVARGLDLRHRLVLRGVSALVVTTAAAGGDEVAVRIEADLAERRSDLGWLVAGTTTGGTLAGGVLAAVLGFDLATLLVVPSAAAGASSGVALARRTYRDQLSRLTDDLEGMLDRLEGR